MLHSHFVQHSEAVSLRLPACVLPSSVSSPLSQSQVHLWCGLSSGGGSEDECLKRRSQLKWWPHLTEIESGLVWSSWTPKSWTCCNILWVIKSPINYLSFLLFFILGTGSMKMYYTWPLAVINHNIWKGMGQEQISNTMHTISEILYRLKMEQNSETCCNMDRNIADQCLFAMNIWK